MLEIGIEGYEEQVVSAQMTASHIGSGAVGVLATAMMIALMENACRKSVKPYLEEAEETVGTHVNVSHCSATPVGLRIWSRSKLVEIDRRRLVFEVAAYDEKGLIGEGTHERFIIQTDRFMAKTRAKGSEV